MFENLRAEMKRNNKTVEDVGKILDISTNTVSFKLNGKTQFTLHELWKLADAFNCPLDYLAGRNWVNQPQK